MTGIVAAAAAASKRNYTVNLPASISATDTRSGLASAQISINRNGTWVASNIGGTTSSGDWVAPKHSTVGDLFDVKYDYSGDALTSGLADNTYGQISTDRAFQLAVATVSSASNSGTFSIRRRSDSVVVDTASGSLSVTGT